MPLLEKPLALAGGVITLAAYIRLIGPDVPVNALGLAVLCYGLVQGGAFAYRGARVVVALRCGRRLGSVRLAPLLAVRFKNDDPPAAVRRTAASGTGTLVLYGIALVSAGTWLGASWAAIVQEAVVQIGWWCVTIGVVDLLPLGLPGVADAHELWGWAWRPRQAWLAYTPAFALWLAANVLVSLQFPSGYTHQLLDFVLADPVALSMLLLSTMVMWLIVDSRRARLGAAGSVRALPASHDRDG